MAGSILRAMENSNNKAEMQQNENIQVNYADFNQNFNPDNIAAIRTDGQIRALVQFLDNHRDFITKSGDLTTNIINRTGDVPRSMCIPPAHQQEFFAHLEACYRAQVSQISFLEKQVYPSGIMLDFDRYQKDKEKKIGQKHFNRLGRELARFFMKNLEIPGSEFRAHVFIIERQEITAEQNHKKYGNCYKYGFHILIPDVWVTKEFKQYLIDHLADVKVAARIFKDADCTLQPPHELIDRNSSSVPVLFLGSATPGKKPYILTYQADISLSKDDHDEEEIEVDCVIPDAAKLGQVNLVYELSLTFQFNEYIHNGEFKPAWLKKQVYKPTGPAEEKIRAISEKRAAAQILRSEDIDEIHSEVGELCASDSEARYLKQIMDQCLTPAYYTDYNKWRDVIFALAHSSSRFRPIAHWFSQKCPEKYSRAYVDRLWEEAFTRAQNGNHFTKRSIIYWARECDRAKFAAVSQGSIFEQIRLHIYDTEGDVENAFIARILANEFGHRFVVVPNGSKSSFLWYEFVTEYNSRDRRGTIYKWRQETPPFTLMRYVYEKLPQIYTEIQKGIKDAFEKATEKPIARFYANVLKNFKSSKKRLQNQAFAEKVMLAARGYFADYNFLEELDSYPEILGVGNGILMIGAEPKLIRGIHEYKVSRYTPINYIPFDPAREQIVTLLEAFRAIFIEDDVFEFMMMYLSTALGGGETEPILLLIKGGGSNGKSFTTEMVAETLGDDYAYKAPLAFLTRPREDSEKPNSAYASCEGKRLIYFSEPNGIENLNVGRVKEITSGERQTNRDLNTKQKNFRMKGTLVTTTNHDFRIETTDEGTWRRIRVYNTKIKFTLSPDPTNKYERKENPRLMKEHKNDPEYKQAMLAILVHYNQKLHALYGGNIRNVPCPTIAQETEEFRNRQDTLNKFITQMIVRKLPGKRAEEYSLTEVALKYIEWYKRHINTNIRESIQDISTQLQNSKISRSLERRNNMDVYLIGHRLRADEKEPIGPDEEYISSPAAKGSEKPENVPEKPQILTKEALANNIVGDL